MPRDVYDSSQINVLRKELQGLMAKEEIHWRQRLQICWLCEGDRNTKFYYACATQRKATNIILGFRDSDGSWQEDPACIATIATDYFTQIFTSTNTNAISNVVHHVDSVVSPDMNDLLLQPFTREEITCTLFQINPSKALGPDGMTALFFQKFWNIVDNDLTIAVLDFLNTGKMLGSINFTHIALIPQVKSVESMGQLRPISLCNVVYKIISKVLVNR